jgi:hypothetical protein
MRVRIAMTMATIILIVASGLVRAQSGGDPSTMLGAGYDLTWNTMDSGGGVSSGGAYALGGAIGQPDAGALKGGDYTLSGGFWQASESSEPPAHRVYLPLVLK